MGGGWQEDGWRPKEGERQGGDPESQGEAWLRRGSPGNREPGLAMASVSGTPESVRRKHRWLLGAPHTGTVVSCLAPMESQTDAAIPGATSTQT